MLNIKRDRVPNTTIYNLTKTVPLVVRTKTRQLKILGHIIRLPNDEPIKEYALYVPSHGKRKPGRQQTLFPKYNQRLLGDMDSMLNHGQLSVMAHDRCSWRKLVAYFASKWR